MIPRVKVQVIGDESGDEEIAVVVAFLHPEVQWHAGTLARVSMRAVASYSRQVSRSGPR